MMNDEINKAIRYLEIRKNIMTVDELEHITLMALKELLRRED